MMASTRNSVKYYLKDNWFNHICHFRNRKVPRYHQDTKNIPFNVRGQMQSSDKACIRFKNCE